MDQQKALASIEQYFRELETANRKLSIENAQLRVSHSYRLGSAFVNFAKRRRLSALPLLLKELRQALRPQSANVPAPSKRPYNALLSRHRFASSGVLDRVEGNAIGSEIAWRVGTKPTKFVGIIGDALRQRWSSLVAGSNLPFDRYDSEWATLAPTHLIVEVDALTAMPGWQHALTLRDPSATVELAAMLAKARRAGMKTVLIEPREPHLFPLLSRIRPLVDTVLISNEAAAKAFADLDKRDV